MKKILYIVVNLGIGGIENFCYQIVKGIDKNKFKIDFMVTMPEKSDLYYENKLKKYGCRVYKCGQIFNKADKRRVLAYEEDLIKRNNYDIVHSHADFLNISTLRVAKQCGVKIRISHVHTTFNKNLDISFKTKLMRYIKKGLMSRYSTVQLGCSEASNKDFYMRGKARVCANGVEIEKYMNIRNGEHNPYVLLHIGRITEAKNPIFICELMSELVKLGKQYKLIWVGDANNKLKEKVVNKISEYQLTPNILMVGATTDTIKYLSESGYFLLPSKYEGLPFSLIEAQMSGVFCFYSDAVTDEANLGYAKKISLRKTAHEWAEIIDDFIRKNKSKEYGLDQNKVKQYDIRNTIRYLEKLYEENVC